MAVDTHINMGPPRKRRLKLAVLKINTENVKADIDEEVTMNRFICDAIDEKLDTL